MSRAPGDPETAGDVLDAVVIGAGISGLYGIHKLRGLGFTVRAFEKGPDIGGTWYWNAYPGAHCDVYSWDYSYSFSPELVDEWSWSERYATQAEIMRYLHHVADRFNLWNDIELNVAVTAVHFDDDADRWNITTADGRVFRSRYVLDATGILSVPTTPKVPGVEGFEGAIVHTGSWPQQGVDVAGKRVGLIGTGSSGSQVAPWLAENAAELTVFQRRPAYVIPAHHYRITPEEEAEVKRTYRQRRADIRYSFGGVPILGTDQLGSDTDDETLRERVEAAWAEGGNAPMQLCFADMAVSRETNARVTELVREKVAAIVEDPETARLVQPGDYPLGAKRVVVTDGYYEIFNRPNVSLVSIKETPIERFTDGGLVVDGVEHPLDIVVCATGFDAISGAIFAMDVRGRGGKRIADAWADGPVSYLGLSIPDFPNYFLVAGPQSPSIFSNFIDAAEYSIDYTAELIQHAERQGWPTIEAEPVATEAWATGVNDVANATVYADTPGWYSGTNVAGKPRRWTAYLGVGPYRQIVEGLAAQGYPGFRYGGTDSHGQPTDLTVDEATG